jgi:hypothetical protein
MEFLADLWLPIILSAVFIFIVSSIIHMVTPWHKGDTKQINNEEAVLTAMRSNNVRPGAYMFPYCGSMKDMGTPEFAEKLKTGPVGFLTVFPPGGMNMTASLVAWFVYTILVGILVAYVSHHALNPGAEYLAVFRMAGAAAVLGYCMGAFQESIWKGQSWKVTGKFIFDGFVYALVTAGTFAWLWPEGLSLPTP